MLSREKTRLFVSTPLARGQAVELARDQAHYLVAVMRLGPGARVALFDGASGEWSAELVEAGRRGARLVVLGQSAPQLAPPDVWLMFAPIKKARTDFIVEKAAELGVARIVPVTTEHTHAERVNVERLQAHAVEAAEQCGGTFVPPVEAPRRLGDVLDAWDPARQIMFADESLVGARVALGAQPRGPWAVLTGPEGGFSEAERARLRALPFAHAVSLGPRILRADTAAVAALTLWQAALGDW